MVAHELKQILHVEDNPGDVLITQEAFSLAGIPAKFSIASTGDEAVDFLKRRGPYADAVRPDLVILDLNLPVRSGQEILDDMRTDPELSGLIVAVLTSSPTDTDVCSRYDRHMCHYFQKSATFDGLVTVVKRIEEFWRASRSPA